MSFVKAVFITNLLLCQGACSGNCQDSQQLLEDTASDGSMLLAVRWVKTSNATTQAPHSIDEAQELQHGPLAGSQIKSSTHTPHDAWTWGGSTSPLASMTSWVLAACLLEACALVVCHSAQRSLEAEGDGAGTLAKQADLDDDKNSRGIWLWLVHNEIGKLLAPHFGTCRSAQTQAGLLSLLMMLQCFMDFQYNNWELFWWDLVYERRTGAFWAAVASYLVLMFAHTMTCTATEYWRGVLALDFRTSMTKTFLDLSFMKNAQLVLQTQIQARSMKDDLDNIDQRIQEDVDYFTCSIVEMTWDAVHNFIYLVIFSWVVLDGCPSRMYGFVFLPGWPIFCCSAFSALGMAIAQWAGEGLTGINKVHEKREALFRKILGHVEENAESIAVSGSGQVEKARVLRSFTAVRSVWLLHLFRSAGVRTVTASVEYLEWMLPLLVLVPLFLSHELSFGQLFQLSTALSHVASSLNWFVNSFSSLTELRASAERLLQLHSCLEAAADAQPKDAPSRSAETCKAGKPDSNMGLEDSLEACPETDVELSKESFPVWIDSIQVKLPSGEEIWHKLSWQLRRGQHVLLSGAEGQGKSIIFKVLAGAWPYVHGGKIWLHEDHFFMPQKPVIPGHLSLREQLSYPDPPNTYSDDDMLWALREVNLHRILAGEGSAVKEEDDEDSEDEEPEKTAEAQEIEEAEEDPIDVAISKEDMLKGLGKEANWNQRLSGGMQQRLLFARVFLRKPMVVFLDEAVCHVSKSSVVELYGSLYRNLPQDALVVSISHDTSTLMELHDTHYVIAGKGRNKRLHLAEQHTFSVHNAKPGMFVVVLRQNEWDEVLLCAQLLQHGSDHWLACTTDQQGESFVWAAVEIRPGCCLPVANDGATRSVGIYMDDDINWICTPPDCEVFWCPSQGQIQKLIEEAAKAVQKLADVPKVKLEAALDTLIPKVEVEKTMEELVPGHFALFLMGDEWIEMLLCHSLDENRSQWLCRASDEFGDAFIWTVARLLPGQHKCVIGHGSDRSSKADIPSAMISWMCEPPECEVRWCPSDAEIEELLKESQPLLNKIDYAQLDTRAAPATSHIEPLEKLLVR
eukprot:TRINITY_DN24168_c0_g1_i2.p1 TRINITY_DN24168_c0_g1~~TRINITY_DN24168_c0_g1_i2.p1  ORF type:complete len:1079 (-),score=186.20 TRINITY_DN24168_c0_g1_i2:269-3505(-)